MLDRLRKHLWCSGARALSDEDLLVLLLRGPAAPQLAAEILQEGLAGLMQLVPSQRPGFGKANMTILLAAVELARRLARFRMPERRLLNRTDLAADYLHLRYHNPDQEIMGALYLDIRGRLIADGEMYRGTQSRSAAEPRGILKQALLHGASAVVLFHTHPSGYPAPSAEDLVFTRRMAEAGELVGVRLLDHIIVGHAGRWVSLQKRGAW
jgi:DNA repair protein RadC